MNRSISKYSPDPKLRPSARFGAMLLAMLAVAGVVTPLVTTQVQAQTNNGVTVTPSTLAFDEGTSDSYTVVLDTQPEGDVIIDVTPNFYSSSPSTVSISETNLTFTADNWDSPQTVTITALEDSDTRDLRFDINHQVSGYPLVPRVQSVEVEIYDDDEPKIRLSNPRPKVNEGGSVTYTVWMNTRPSHQKLNMIPFSYSDKITVYPTSLEFTNENWRTPQTITITAAHDEDAIDDVFEVMHSFGSGYASGRTTFARVTAIDDEKSRVMTYPTSLTIEAGETERYWVSLDDLPYVNDVTVTITSDNPAVTVNPSTLTFNRTNWTRTKGVNVTASDGPATLTHTMSGYNPVKTLKVNVPGGAPTISGTAQVGQTLTASTSAITDTDGLTNVSYSYQWLADDTEINGATNSTYTPQTTDIGKVIKVRVTFTDNGDNDESLTSAGWLTVTATVTVNNPATGAPTISGTAQVGQTLTASTSAITDTDGLTNVSYSYQWLADDTEINGATNSTYTPQTTDIGKVIKVRVTFTDDGDNDEPLTSAGTVTVTATVNRPATGAPTISGTAQVGQTLTASTSAITDPDGLTNVSYSYQWLADDTEINRATNSTYTPQTTDIGKVIKVRVTFTDNGDNDEQLTSAGTVTVTATVNNPATGTPTISGTAQVGQTLTASTSAITDPDGLTNVSYSYQWLADDTEINGATNSTYTPQTTDIGKVIKVRVTFTDDGDNDEQLTSAAYPGSGTIIAATTKRPIGPVAPTKVTTDPAKDNDADNDADGDSDDDDDTDTDTDTESGDGDESQSGENRIDCDDLETQTPFVDVLESSPEAQAIACIYALGLTTGTSPTTYSPGANVTRAQMASFLARLYKAVTGTDAPIADTPFTDVATTSPTYNDIGRIYGLSITTGTSPTSYSPGANVTRAQMASFLARLYKAVTGTDAPIADTPFTDVATTSPTYNDIGRIYGLSITTGTSPTSYSPGANVTRAQMASFLARLYKATTGTEAP